MAKKTYTIPYDPRSETWEPLTITAQVRDHKDQKVQKLTPEVLVEDGPEGEYPAFDNSVLLLDDVQVEQRIEAGDVAKIRVRLNDGDARLLDVLKQHSEFEVKVTLRPELREGGSEASKPGPPVEGITSVYAQLPQTWDLTFRKTLWEDAGVIDLTTLEEVPQDQLRELGDWGGKLILRPQGCFVDEETGEEILSTETVAHARECLLDRGDEEQLSSPWDPEKEGYVFEIEPSRSREGPEAPATRELIIQPHVAPHQGWQRQLSELLAGARAVGDLAPDVPQAARDYVQDSLDHLSTKTDEEIADRRRQLNIWILNTSHFLEFMGDATEMFNKALGLLETAHKRFVDNMVNLFIQITFSVFDLVKYAVRGTKDSVKTAIKASSKEMVEELSERTARELAQQRDVLEQGVKQVREGIRSIDDRLAAVLARKPTDLSNPTPALLRQLDEVIEESTRLTRQRDELLEQLMRQNKELVDLEANLVITRKLKENAKKATEKEFLERLKKEAMELPESPEIRRIVADVEDIGRRDVGRIMQWHDEIQQTLNNLPPDASEQARGNLERLSRVFSQHVERIRTETLIDFSTGPFSGKLEKTPLADRLKEVQKRAQQAKQEAEGIPYQNAAWDDYEGFFSPVWWFMDWSLAQISWLHGLAREWIPWLAMAEDGLVLVVDTVLYYVMAFLNALIDYMNSNNWRRSCINAELRGRGRATAMANGIHGGFFDFPRTTKQLPEMVTPRRVVSTAQNGSASQMRSVKQQVLSSAFGGYKREASAQRGQARQAFANLCRSVLDAGRLEQEAPDHVSSGSMRGVWPRLAGPMVKYEKAFAAASAQGTDYLWSGGHFAQAGVKDGVFSWTTFYENSTFQDWDGAIEWLGWAVAWGLRLGSVLAVFTGVGAAAVPVAFSAAEAADWITGLLRPAVSWLGTMPDVIAFQRDVVLAAALAYEAATVGNVDLNALVVPSEYVEWSEA